MHMFEYHKNKGGNDEFYPSQIYNFIRSLFRVSIDFKCLPRGKCYRQDIVVESATHPLRKHPSFLPKLCHQSINRKLVGFLTLREVAPR
jgi:hypothetical protein